MEEVSGRAVQEAFDQVQYLVKLIRACNSKAEFKAVIDLAPMMGDYVKLPDGKENQKT